MNSDPFIVAAHVFRAIALVLGILGISGGALLVFAWWRDCRAARQPLFKSSAPRPRVTSARANSPYFTRHHLES